MSWLQSVCARSARAVRGRRQFAIAILVWAAFVALVVVHVIGHVSWTGPALFSGLACILIESVVRFFAAAGEIARLQARLVSQRDSSADLQSAHSGLLATLGRCPRLRQRGPSARQSDLFAALCPTGDLFGGRSGTCGIRLELNL